MQAKISAFFKPSTAVATVKEKKKKTSPPPPPSGDSLEPSDDALEVGDLSGKRDPDILVTYSRRHPNPDADSDSNEIHMTDEEIGKFNDLSVNSSKISDVGKVLNKKRSYAQYHLELGQSDFLLHTCSVCGLNYACGDEGDEKVHETFHRNYYLGIQFKGWHNERVIPVPWDNGDRIILVLDCDPPAHKHKVQQVVKVMEGELGLSEGWLIHRHCKVYLFISNHRIVGCLVAESIRTAHRVISNSISSGSSEGASTKTPKQVTDISKFTGAKSTRPNQTVLHFGNISFQREAAKRSHSTNKTEFSPWDSGAIFCEKDAVPALCGIRAIWVVPSKRRQHIATLLLDSVRKSFVEGSALNTSKCAFSQPTSLGKAFASSYSNTESFLVYKVEDY